MNDPKGILDEVKKAVVGKDGVLVMALLAILAGGHILLEDIPGVGNPTLGIQGSNTDCIAEKGACEQTPAVPGT